MGKFLITGSSGFIGSNLTNYLKSNGNEVAGLDIRGEPDILSDIRNINWGQVDLHSFDGVIHLAARVSVPESFEKPKIYREVNVDSTLRLFESCVAAGVPRVAFASSAAVYGDAGGGIMRIGKEGTPLSPYAESKLEGEKIARELSTQQTKISCFRFFNVYGPGQSYTTEYASVIPIFINKMLESGQLTIYGDGKQTRDFIYVHDICKVLAKVFSVDLDPFSVYNVGSGLRVSINSLFQTMAEIFEGHSVPVRAPIYAPPRRGDIDHSLADINETISKFPDAIGTSLREGLSDLIESYFDEKYGVFV